MSIQEQAQKILSLLNDPLYKPMKPKELAHLMQVPEDAKQDFKQLLDQLEAEGKMTITAKGRVVLPQGAGLIKGTFIGNVRGFGFVVPEEGQGDDVYIPAEDTGKARHKDVVLCRLTRNEEGNRRSQGVVVKILSRGFEQLVGTFYKEKTFGVVVPDDPKLPIEILVDFKDSQDAVTGHKVTVKIIEKENQSGQHPQGVITGILGHRNDPGVDILSIIYRHNLPIEFDGPALEQLDTITGHITPEEISNRRDLRHLQTITIDGADTKDVDDAVTLDVLPDGGYRLGVHIADVSHYVKAKTPLDKAAYQRGTSVYLADRVIPMLPPKLSNDICSLNPEVDRLALSCIMTINPQGKVIDHEIVNAIIQVDAPINYDKVAEILTNDQSPLREAYAAYMPLLEGLARLSEQLRENRVKRGAIEFDFPEPKLILDEKGHPTDIVLRRRNIATGIIEECMILCNETIASAYAWLTVPFVYRCHEKPEEDKLRTLWAFAGHFGYKRKGRGNHAMALQGLLSKIESAPEEAMISRVMLRSLKQARYTHENIGHFGLASDAYCHFTSPIRRYPDLLIHRIIKAHLAGGYTKMLETLNEHIEDLCRHCSTTERRAEMCERDVMDMKKVAYMADKVGQIFTGVISGVTGWGMFVELPNTVEGMVPMSDIPGDYYIYDKERLCLTGERTGKTYALGDMVTVQLVMADEEACRLTFTLSF